jgi:hypothetical protein
LMAATFLKRNNGDLKRSCDLLHAVLYMFL